MKIVGGAVLAVIILAAALGLFLRGPFAPAEKSATLKVSMAQTVRLKAQDGVEIAGDYYPSVGEKQISAGASRGAVLLHMMPSDRKSWEVFAQKLSKIGFPVLAIDLRGHGESQGGPEGYKSFSDAEHQNSRQDVIAAAIFLRSKGVDEFHLIGASIGANLALQYLAEHSNARSAVLLSPGLDYRGIKSEPFITKVKTGRGIFLAASEEDSYSYESVNKLVKYWEPDEAHKLKILQNAGHGTTMLEKNPEFMEEIINWLVKL